MKLKWLLLPLLIVVLSACGSKTKKVVQIVTPEMDYLLSKDAKQIIEQGSNSAPVFSDDGSKIYFISKGRPGHRNTQIYEYDLILRSQRRITFQDGEVVGVAPFNEDQLLYASTTDEIKEEPFIKDTPLPRSEIYLSDLYGNQITRLTSSPGYDGEMLFSPAKRQILFTSNRSGLLGLYWLNPEDDKVTPFQVDGRLSQRLPVLSSDERTAFWVQDDPTAKTESLVSMPVNGKDKKILKTLQGSIKSLTLNAQGQLLYTLQPEGTAPSHLEVFDPAKNCTQIALKTGMSLGEAQFSSRNPNLMIFRATQNDHGVIYQWELPKDLGPCLEQGPSDTIRP